MKTLTVFILFVAISISCTKENSAPEVPTTVFESGPQTYGWVKAKKNGLEFNASAFALKHTDRPDEYFGIQFETYSEGGFLRENFFFNKIKYLPEEYIVSGEPNNIYDGFVSSGYFGLAGDGHGLHRVYKLDESADNTLTVTYVDTVENVVRGTFDVSYKLDWAYSPPPDPDKIRLSEGEFEVTITF